MALTIGELVAYIRADGTQFDRQVDQSGQKFAGLGKVVGAGTKALATSFVVLTTGAAAVGAAVFKVGADYNRLQQSSRAALTTLLGSAEAANAQMDKLDEFATSSPFAKQVFVTAQQQLLGFGVSAEKVLPTLDAIQNAVAATGGSSQQVADLTSIFAKISAAGKLTAQDLMEFGNRGVDAATLIGSQMDKTGGQIREDITAGSLDAQVALDALVAGMNDRFGGATDNIKQQFDGAADRVKGAWRDIGSVVAAPFIDPNGGGRAVEWANKLADALRALETKAKPVVDLLVKRFAPGLAAVSPALDRVRGAINSWDVSKLNGQLDRLSGYTPLITAGSAALYAYGTASIPILSKLGLSMNPVVAGIAALVATSPALRAAGGELLSALSPLLPVVQELTRVFADAALSVINQLASALVQLAPSITDLMQAVAPLVVVVGTDLASALVAAASALGPVADIITNVVGATAELPAPVLAAAAAFAVLMAVRPQLANLVTSFKTATTSIKTFGTTLKTTFIGNPVTLAIMTVATAVGYLAGKQAEAKQRAEDLAETLDQVTGAATQSTETFIANKIAASESARIYKNMGGNVADLTAAALGSADAITRVNELLDEQPKENFFGFESDSSGVAEVRSELEGLSGDLERGTTLVQLQREALDGSSNAFKSNADAVQEANQVLQDNIKAQKDAAGVAMSLREAQIAETEARNAATEAAAAGAQVTRDAAGAADLNAESTIAADRALLDLASRSAQVTEAMMKQDATGQELYDITVTQRGAFIDAAQAMGYSAEEAGALANQYGLIPEDVTTLIEAETAEAEANARKIKDLLEGIGISDPTAKIYADTSAADISLNALQDRMRRVVSGLTMTTSAKNQANGGVWDGKVQTFADGGVSLADGRPVARTPQVSTAGRNILWSEPETGWEAYISGKPSEKRRNLQVLEEAARRLGVVAVPNVTAHAAGSITPAPAAPQVGSVAAYLTDAQVERLAQAFEVGSSRATASAIAGRDFVDRYRGGY